MKLPIAQLKEGENPFTFSSTQDPWVNEIVQHIDRQGSRTTSPLKLDLCITKLEPDYVVRGKLACAVQQTCARCAEAFTLPLDHSFTVAMAHISGPNVRNPQLLSEESDELDICFFEGNDIDLSPVVQEQFFLSLPYQALCRPDCRGICQQCGVNRNERTCQCTQSDSTNPFSKLKGLIVS